MTELLADDSINLVACPYFLNPRGYVWMALALLLDVPMSISDLHFIHPWHIKGWASALGMNAELVTTVDRNWAYGSRLLKDFDKRLHNALGDAKLPTDKVDNYLKCLSNLVQYLDTANSCPGLDASTVFYNFVT